MGTKKACWTKKFQPTLAILMLSPVRLRDCSGFGERSISEWDFLRHGLEFSTSVPDDSSTSTCYVCFDPQESARSLASRSVRLRCFVGPDAVLVSSRAYDYAAFVSTSLLAEPAAAMDLLGGLLLRAPKNFQMVAPLVDTLEFLHHIIPAIGLVKVSETRLVSRIFSKKGSANDFLRDALGICVVRDVLASISQDGREVASSLTDAIVEISKTRNHWSVLADVIGKPITEAIAMLNAHLETLKPQIDSDAFIDDWELAVQKLWNRPAPPQRKRAVPAAKMRKSLRKRQAKKQLSTDSEKSDDEKMETVKLVVDNWLQCDNCSKWRIVSTDLLSSFEDKFFQCSDVQKSCSDPADEESVGQ